MNSNYTYILSIVSCMMLFFNQTQAEEVGSVDTKFKLFGPDHKIVIEAFDDPKVEGVACHLSRAKTGGFKGLIGVAEDTSDASIACRQIGPIRIIDELEEADQVFSERRSLIFKKLQVVRFFDKKRNTLIYLAYSDRIIEGSPKKLYFDSTHHAMATAD